MSTATFNYDAWNTLLDLGRIGSPADGVFHNYRTFRQWVDEILDPAARQRGITSCEMCHRHLAELPVPRYEGIDNRQPDDRQQTASRSGSDL